MHRVITVSLNSLDCVLRRGCVVTLNPGDALGSFERLSGLSTFAGVWASVDEARTLDETRGKHWQILDMSLKLAWDR